MGRIISLNLSKCWHFEKWLMVGLGGGGSHYNKEALCTVEYVL